MLSTVLEVVDRLSEVQIFKNHLGVCVVVKIPLSTSGRLNV